MQCAWALIYCHLCPVPHYLIFYFLWCRGPTRAKASSALRSLDHIQRRTTVDTSPLDEWSARRRDLYLTTCNTQKRETSMFTAGFKPTISAGERPQIHGLYRAASGIRHYLINGKIFGENDIEYIKCVFIFSATLSEVFLILRRIQRYIVINVDWSSHTRVGTLIVATIYLQLIQNRYMFRSFTVLHCSHQHCVQPVASDVEVVGYL